MHKTFSKTSGRHLGRHNKLLTIFSWLRMTILTMALLVLTVSCTEIEQTPPSNPEPDTPSAADSEVVAVPNDWQQTYSKIIKALSDFQESGFQTFDEEMLEETILTGDGRFESSLAGIGFDIYSCELEYALYDLNKDGTPELFISALTEHDTRSIQLIYTCKGIESELLIAGSSGHTGLDVYPEGTILQSWGHMGDYWEKYYQLSEAGVFENPESFFISTYSENDKGDYINLMDDSPSTWFYFDTQIPDDKHWSRGTAITYEEYLERISHFPDVVSDHYYVMPENIGKRVLLDLDWNMLFLWDEEQQDD